jgi:hypothetical protein
MSTDAPIQLADVAYEKRMERHRLSVMSHMQHSMQAQILEIERIKKLGAAEAAKAVKHFRERIAHLNLTARSLQQDFEELCDGEETAQQESKA